MYRKLALVLLLAGVAHAGSKINSPVLINSTHTMATGVPADARASSDSRQSIGCRAEYLSGTISGLCWATDATGVNLYCSIPSTNSACLLLDVENASDYSPKQR